MMKTTKEVGSQKSHKGQYEVGVIYLPKEWIGKKVEIKEIIK
jgi:hypothetical protein